MVLPCGAGHRPVDRGLRRDGAAAGQVTSAAWGETLGRCAGLAYLWDPDGGPIDARWIGEGSYEVNVGGDAYPVAVTTSAICGKPTLNTLPRCGIRNSRMVKSNASSAHPAVAAKMICQCFLSKLA